MSVSTYCVCKYMTVSANFVHNACQYFLTMSTDNTCRYLPTMSIEKNMSVSLAYVYIFASYVGFCKLCLYNSCLCLPTLSKCLHRCLRCPYTVTWAAASNWEEEGERGGEAKNNLGCKYRMSNYHGRKIIMSVKFRRKTTFGCKTI